MVCAARWTRRSPAPELTPRVAAEIDSLAMLMEAVDAGLGGTLQPWAAVARFPDADRRFHLADISDAGPARPTAVQPVGRRTVAGGAGGARGAGRLRPRTGAVRAMGGAADA